MDRDTSTIIIALAALGVGFIMGTSYACQWAEKRLGQVYGPQNSDHGYKKPNASRPHSVNKILAFKQKTNQDS